MRKNKRAGKIDTARKKMSISPPPDIMYRKLMDHMAEAVWVGDKRERTVYANPKFCSLVGYRLKEIIGRESYDFWDEESRKTVRRVNASDRKRGVSSPYEGNLVMRDGRKIPVRVNGTPLPDGGTIGIITDLTELKKQESMFQRLVEHMNEALWMGDKRERTVYANPKFCSLVGYRLSEILGRESYDFWDEESRQRVKHVNMHQRKKGVSSSYEGNLVTRDGRKIPVLLSGTPLPHGGTFGIITDLTELKKKEEMEKVLNSALEYASDAVIIFNAERRITSWNKGAKMIFGYRKEEIMGRSVDRIFDPEEFDAAVRSSSVLYNFEIHGYHKNRHELNISLTLTPFFGDGGGGSAGGGSDRGGGGSDRGKNASFYLLICRDITAQKKFEEELYLKYQKIQEAYNRFGILRRQMDYIFDFLDLASKYLDRKSIADFIVSSIIMLTRVDACVLRSYNKNRDTLDLVSFFGMSQDYEGKSSIPFRGSLCERALQQKTPLKILDVMKEPRYQSPALAKKHRLVSLLLIPLEFHGRMVGSLSLYTGPDKALAVLENDFIEKYAKLIDLVMETLKDGQ